MSVANVAGTARALLRDFPKFYEIETGPLNTLTIRLPHPLISPSSVQVFVGASGAAPDDPWTAAETSSWSLDERNGLLKLTDAQYLNKRVLTSGYYYTWFTDSDLLMHAEQAANDALHPYGTDYDDLEGVYGEVVAMGAVVRALWSMATELAFDIDVSTPEGMFIPARQRYAQVLQMMQYWEGQYTERANSLGLGLGVPEVFQMRRISRLTNRYVPVYREREVDDHRWPKRLYPPIPDGALGPGAGTEPPDVIEVTESLQPYGRQPGIVQDIGWYSVGTSGQVPYGGV